MAEITKRASQAVILSGLMNFPGVIAGDIAVAYALVVPPEILSPPNGAVL